MRTRHSGVKRREFRSGSGHPWPAYCELCRGGQRERCVDSATCRGPHWMQFRTLSHFLHTMEEGAVASPTTDPVTTMTAGEHQKKAKKATGVAAFGTFIEYYDFSVYGYVAATLSVVFLSVVTTDPSRSRGTMRDTVPRAAVEGSTRNPWPPGENMAPRAKSAWPPDPDQ